MTANEEAWILLSEPVCHWVRGASEIQSSVQPGSPEQRVRWHAPCFGQLCPVFQHAVLFHPAFGPGGDQEQEEGVDQQENANGNIGAMNMIQIEVIRLNIWLGASYQAEVEEEEGHKHEDLQQ